MQVGRFLFFLTPCIHVFSFNKTSIHISAKILFFGDYALFFYFLKNLRGLKIFEKSKWYDMMICFSFSLILDSFSERLRGMKNCFLRKNAPSWYPAEKNDRPLSLKINILMNKVYLCWLDDYFAIDWWQYVDELFLFVLYWQHPKSIFTFLVADEISFYPVAWFDFLLILFCFKIWPFGLDLKIILDFWICTQW